MLKILNSPPHWAINPSCNNYIKMRMTSRLKWTSSLKLITDVITLPCPVSSKHMSHVATVGIKFCSHHLEDINIRWIIRKTLYIYIYEKERSKTEKKNHYSLLLKNVAYVRRLLYLKSLWFFRKLWILVLVYHFWNLLFSFTVFQTIKLFRKILDFPSLIYCIKIVCQSF